LIIVETAVVLAREKKAFGGDSEIDDRRTVMISPEASGSLDVYSFGSQENKELECRTE